MAALAAAHADAAPSSAPVLSRPALLSHIFKFAAREPKDVKLMYVASAWEDTAINYSPFMWSRMSAAWGIEEEEEAPPQAAPSASIEQHSQELFNRFLCRCWAHLCSAPSVLDRLVHPTVADLTGCCNINDAGLQQLATQQQLLTLNLTYCDKITDAGVGHIAVLSQLKSLNVSHCSNATDASVAHATSIKTLQALDLSGCDKVTDAGVGRLASSSLRESLRELKLAWCDKITAAAAADVASIKHLQTLDVAWIEALVTDATLQEQLGKLSALRWLNITGCKQFSAAGLAALPSSIQNLNLAYCTQLDDDIVQPLSKLTGLQALDLRGCAKLSGSAKTQLQTALPNCVFRV